MDEARSADARPGRAAGSGPQATVLNVQRMSTEDGPGLRTTVFFKGCSLACLWCHNPEALAAEPQIVWHEARCIGAQACEAHCPEDAVRRSGEVLAIDRERCTLCGVCVDECPTGALELLGRRWSVEDLVREVAKDRSYFATSEGGVTVSGGEPGLRAAFVAPFLEACRALGLHTAVDTCGMCADHALFRIAAEADLVLYDLKEIDSERHARFTRQPNERVIDNLRGLAEQVRLGPRPREIWIRTPLVPGATLTEANIRGIGALIAREARDVVTRWELLAFNNLAGDKYRRLGMEWAFADTDLIAGEELRRFEQLARGSGVEPDIVRVTGRARLECPPGNGVEGDAAAG